MCKSVLKVIGRVAEHHSIRATLLVLQTISPREKFLFISANAKVAKQRNGGLWVILIYLTVTSDNNVIPRIEFGFP